MENLIQYLQGDIMDTGLEAASFDAVWCQHTLMNIKEKGRGVFRIQTVSSSPAASWYSMKLSRAPRHPIHLPVPLGLTVTQFPISCPGWK